MRKTILVIFEFLKKAIVPILLPFFLYLSDSINLFDTSGAVQVAYMTLVVFCIVGIAAFSNRDAQKPSMIGGAMVVNAIVYMIAYSTLRSIVGTSQIELYLVEKFHLSNKDLYLFKSIFSIGYGICQFFTGYLTGQFGNRIIGLFGAVSAICIFLINSSFINSLPLLILIRFINGISVSCGILSISYQLRILRVNRYSIIFNASNTLVSTMNAVVMNQLSRFINPHAALNFLSLMFFIPSVVFLMNGFLVKHSVVLQEVNYRDVVKTALFNRQYSLMMVQSVLIVIAGWTLRDSFLLSICGICSPDSVVATGNRMKYTLEIGFIYGFMFVLFYLKGDRYKQLMKWFSFANLFSAIILFINNYLVMPLYVIYTSVFILGVSVKAHLLPQIMAGSSEKDDKLAAGLIGFLNAGVMLLALPFCQQIMPCFSLHTSSLIFVIIALVCTAISLVQSDENKAIE